MSQNEIFLKTRHVQKHDVEENWTKAVNFIPLKGEMIVYDIDETHSYERFKIGDGVTVVSSLPFTTDALRAELESYVDATVERIVKMALSWGTFPEEPVPDEPTEEEEVLEGSGSEYYTLAPTPLSFRSTAPLNEFQEVQINGVTVDPSNYTLEEGSTIVKLSVDYLKTLDKGNYEVAVVSENKTVKGGFTVAAPELNEHGFYYNQPYAAYVDYFSATMVFFIREDGTADAILLESSFTETVTYTVNGNNIIFSSDVTGTYTCTISEDGYEIYCDELFTNFKLGNEYIFSDLDYIYIYKEDIGGYEVTAIDKTKAEPSAIKTGINGVDTVKLADNMFVIYDESGGLILNNYLICAPQIPDSVTTIGNSAFCMCAKLTSIDVPNSVTSIGHSAFDRCTELTSINLPDGITELGDTTFGHCRNLSSIMIPNSVTIIRNEVFRSCESLTDIVIPYGVTRIDNDIFAYCTNLSSISIPNSVERIGMRVFNGCLNLTNIVFTGTIEQWNAIEKIIMGGKRWDTGSNVAYVQCSDGTVAL